MKIKTSLWMLIISFALISLSGSSCQSKKMEEKYEWSGTLSAPKEYPVEVYKGSLIGSDFTQNFRNWGIVNPGWGDAAGTVVSGPEQKTVPDSLSITWLSFVENKFYSGKFALPKDKMRILFKEGFINDMDKHESYSDVIIGLAPGGNISVWLMAAGKEVEVAKFKAGVIQIDPETISSDDKYMFRNGYAEAILSDPMVIVPEVKAMIQANGYPSPNNYSDLYSKKYNWKPVFQLLEGSRIENFGFGMYNGEMDMLHGVSLANNIFKERAVPKRCSFYWKGNNNEEHGVRVLSFDEKEIIEAFKNIGIGNIELLFKAGTDNTVLISLKTDNKTIDIKNAVVKAF